MVHLLPSFIHGRQEVPQSTAGADRRGADRCRAVRFGKAGKASPV